MRCYLINLDRHVERRARMDRLLREAGAQVTRVGAVDAAATSAAALEAHRSPASLYRLSDPEIACFMSHRRAWEALLESGEPYGVVLEDDLVLARSASPFLTRTDWIPADAEIVKLETYAQNVVVSPVVGRANGRALRRLASLHFGTAAYVIGRKAAETLLSLTATFDRTVDDLVFDLMPGRPPRFVTYQLDPAIGIQAPRRSPEAVPAFLESSVPRSPARYAQRSGLRKLRRELVRPIEQFFQFATQTIPLRARGYRRREIPFGED